MYLNFKCKIPTNAIAFRNSSADLIARAHNVAWWQALWPVAVDETN